MRAENVAGPYAILAKHLGGRIRLQCLHDLRIDCRITEATKEVCVTEGTVWKPARVPHRTMVGLASRGLDMESPVRVQGVAYAANDPLLRQNSRVEPIYVV